MLEGIVTRVQAIEAVNKILEAYIQNNEKNAFTSWLEAARTAKKDFNDKFSSSETCNFDELKTYTLQMADKFKATLKSLAGLEGKSTLRSNLKTLAQSWPTHALYQMILDLSVKVAQQETNRKAAISNLVQRVENNSKQKDEQNEALVTMYEKKLEEKDLKIREVMAQSQAFEEKLKSDEEKLCDQMAALKLECDTTKQELEKEKLSNSELRAQLEKGEECQKELQMSNQKLMDEVTGFKRQQEENLAKKAVGAGRGRRSPNQ